VVDDLDIFQEQRDEALVAAGKCLLGGTAGNLLLCLLNGALALWCREEVVSGTTDGGGTSSIDQRVGALLGRLGCVGSRRNGRLENIMLALCARFFLYQELQLDAKA
jgi:hypothetical protein